MQDTLGDAFNPYAPFDDGTCPAVIFGCLDSHAANFRSGANRHRKADCDYQVCTLTW